MAKSKKTSEQKRLKIVFAIIVLGSLLAAITVFAINRNQADDSHMHAGEDEGHAHSETFEYASHENTPTIAIESLVKNEQGAWELNVVFGNFEIRQDKVDQPNVAGEGHAHIYVNGEKITRLFESVYTFEQDLAAGDVVRVELNTNDHKVYTHDGIAIAAEVSV